MPTSTPWGASQASESLCRGIVNYITARHGGVHLAPTRNIVIPEYMRNANGWYEEDCEWAIPATIFPEAWVKHYPDSPDILKTIKDTLRNWYPTMYETFYAVTIKHGESRIRDKETFTENHKNDYLVISAIATDNDTVRCTAHIGGEYGDGCNPKIFIVPYAEYQERGNHSFVIDLDRHVEESR